MVMFRFLKNGLTNGERAIYTTHMGTKPLMGAMVEFGIEVKEFQKEDLLHIIRIRDPLENKESFEKGLEDISRTISAQAKPPFRLVSRFVRNVDSPKTRTANLKIERAFHAAYEGKEEGEMFSWARQGSTMCEYSVKRINAQSYLEWRQANVANHHVAMIAMKSGASKGYFVDAPPLPSA
jgi:hypothetical protein